MPVDTDVLEDLSREELEVYSGNSSARTPESRKRWESLMCSPVRMKVCAGRDECDENLWDLCLRMQGRHEQFMDLRVKINDELMKRYPQFMLTVVFDGVYIGEPEDLRNLRAENGQRVMYEVKGFGRKVGDIEFV